MLNSEQVSDEQQCCGHKCPAPIPHQIFNKNHFIKTAFPNQSLNTPDSMSLNKGQTQNSKTSF